MATEYPTASAGLAAIPSETITHAEVAAEIDGRFESLDAEVDGKVSEDDAAPLADTITATAGNAAVAGTADSAIRSDAVIPMRFTVHSGSTTGFPTLPSGFTDWLTVVATDDRVFMIAGFDTETEVEPPPDGEEFTDDWTRSDGAPGNGWTQISGSFLSTISGNRLYNADAGATNYAGLVRDLDDDVTDATSGTVEVECLGVTGSDPGDPSGTALYIACLASTVSDNVMFWYNEAGASKIMRYVGGVETTMASGMPQLGVNDIASVHIDYATSTYTPSINGTPQAGKAFTSASTKDWTFRGVFLKGLNFAGDFSWTSDA